MDLNCSPSPIGYELRCGTPQYSGRGRKPSYSARRGATVYRKTEVDVNERTNRLLRRFIPKGCSIFNFTDEQILQACDEINAMTRKRLGYITPDEFFEDPLTRIYHI